MLNSNNTNNYYKHIDGIRAMAVIAVIIFHANSTWLPGGFVGVDIFFVISGFLISGLIFKHYTAGQFSLRDFYIRRMRRILPALLVVISFTFAIAWFVLLPDEMRSFSKSIFTSELMYSNQQFVSEAGYFDTQSHLKPLLHTWSLSIEGQFYLLFPLLFIFVLKHTKKPIIYIGLLICISFFYADRASMFESEKSFFYFSARAWELLAGCLLMLFLSQSAKRNHLTDQVLSLLGLSLVLYAIFFFEKSMLHPGKVTLIPIVGTMLLIAFSTDKTIVSKLLTSKLMVGVGLISYSLYLWHQPIISFAKIQFNQLSAIMWSLVFFLIALLSTLTWALVEKPFRSKQLIPTPNFLITTMITGLVLCAIGLWGVKSNGFINQRYDKEKVDLINTLDGDSYKHFLFKHLYANEIPNNKYNIDGRPRLLVVGDSYAADLMNMIIDNQYLSKYQIRTLYIPARCQFYLGDNDYRNLIDKKDAALCEQTQRKLVFLKRNINAFDQIIIVFQWKQWVAEHLKKSIDALALKNEKKLIFIGTKRFIVDKREIIKSDMNIIKSLSSPRVEKIIKINQILASQSAPHIFIDQDKLFCDVNNQCPLFTDQLKPVSVDGQHLTQDGAKYLAQKLFAHEALANLNK